MDKTAIKKLKADARAELERIHNLKEELEATISQLERLEGVMDSSSGVDLGGGSGIPFEGERGALRRRRTKFPQEAKPAGVEQRVRDALVDMPDHFHRSQLKEEAEKSGGPIPDGTFSPIFSRLKQEGEIEVVEEAAGRKQAIYGKKKVGHHAEPSGGTGGFWSSEEKGLEK